MALLAFEAFLLWTSSPRLHVWPDSIGYLGPAMDALELGYFSHWNGRGFVYPLVLWAGLKVSPTPWVIITGQRILVLGTLLCIVLAARRAEQPGSVRNWIRTTLAGFWLLTFILYPPIIGLSQAVMPETLFAFFLSLMLLAVTVATAPTTSDRLRIVTVCLAVVVSTTMVVVKPHWLLAGIVLPFVLALLMPRGRRRSLAKLVAVAFAASIALVIVPEVTLQSRYDSYESRIFGPRSLFCNSSDLVYRFLDAHDATPFSSEVRTRLGRMLTVDARSQAVDWALIGFDGDRCMYGETAEYVSSHFAGRPVDEVSYYLTTYARAAFGEPSYGLKRWARHMAELARKPFNAVTGGYFLLADDSTLAANQSVRPLLSAWRQRDPQEFNGVIDTPLSGHLLALRVFFAAAGVVLVLITALATLRILQRAWRDRDGLVHHERVLLAALLCLFSINTLVAIVHTFEPRYLVMQVPLFAFLGYLASLVVLDAFIGPPPSLPTGSRMP